MNRRFTGYSVYKRRKQRGALAVQLMLVTLSVIGIAGYFAGTRENKDVTDVPSVTTIRPAHVAQAAMQPMMRPNLDQVLEVRDPAGGSKTRFSRKVSDGASSFAIVSDIKMPEKGTYYGVWAVQADPYQFRSLGAMTERADGKFALVYEAKDDLRDFNEILITVEKKDDNPAPGTKVLEGKF